MSIADLSINGGAAAPTVQLSVGGTYTTSGYVLRGYVFTVTPGYGAWVSSNGFQLVNAASAVQAISGATTLTLINPANNTWHCHISLTDPAATSNAIWLASGTVALSGVLDGVRLFLNGTNQFDAGIVNIFYD